MDYSWIGTTWTAILMVLLSTVGIYITLIVFTRIAGLRSFSKMSTFDFAVTVAIGSLIASTIISDSPPLLQAVAALACLYILQIGVAALRGKSKLFYKMMGNEPLLLMDGTDMLEKNMRLAKVTHDDIRAKLREANVTRYTQVKAVVMEVTGDISVLHHKDKSHKLETDLLEDVRGWETNE